MKIQIISYNCDCKNLFDKEDYDFTYTSLSSPQSFDMFDVNIISLQNPYIWRTKENSAKRIDCMNDIESIKTIVAGTHNAITIIVYPQNYDFKYYGSYAGSKYYKTIKIKDNLDYVNNIIMSLITDNIYALVSSLSLVFENTVTCIGTKKIPAAFYFDHVKQILTFSKDSEKPTTVALSRNLILTSLDIKSLSFTLNDFLQQINVDKSKPALPEWVENYNFLDDNDQKEAIANYQDKIQEIQLQIQEAEKKLESNRFFKSALFTNGDNLVKIVFNILERILDCDLSGFQDEKREDFLIKKDSVTFIGEIKGVSSNVKSEHMSQLEVHYQSYLDELQAQGYKENVKALLIINPFKQKPIDQRDEIHENQVQLAIRNNSLIILTETLLKIFEKFSRGKINSQKIIEIFQHNTGLLNITVFNNSVSSNNDAYKI